MKQKEEQESFSFFKVDLLKIKPGNKKVINGVEISRELTSPECFTFRIILEGVGMEKTLLTLKDFNEPDNYEVKILKKKENIRSIVGCKEIKQEIIKWIKELQKEIETIKHNPEAYREFKKNPILFEGEVCHTIRWIKHFFNISEEDLK